MPKTSDEFIPYPDIDDANFYNALFAKKKPVPNLGDA
jgi:hypothetical protein